MRKFLISILVCFGFGLHGLAQSSFDKALESAGVTISNGLIAKSKKKVAIAEFAGLDGKENALGLYVANEFGINLVMSAKAYEVVERKQLQILLKEQRISNEDIIDDSTRVKLGKIYGVDAIIIGTMTVFDEDIRLTIRSLDVETGAVISVAKADITKDERIKQLLKENEDEKESVTNLGGQIAITTNNNISNGVISNRKASDPDCQMKNKGDICFTNNSEYDQVMINSFGGDLYILKNETQCLYNQIARANSYVFSYRKKDSYGKYVEVASRCIYIEVKQCESLDYLISTAP
ncbi:MAG: hypothetical protein IPP69_11540 [Flavobacteriales bacterium]|nr:hypothetical protein [Flavobacteriales bacterium]